MQDCRNKLIITIIIVFVIFQITIVFIFGYTPYPDSNGYIELAKDSLLYGEAYPVSDKINEYSFLWNIGAINIVQLSLYLFDSIIPLLIIYSIIKGITAWMFYEIINTIINKKTAFIALIIYVIYPSNYGESTSVLSELPFMFFCIIGLYLSLKKNKYILGGSMIAIANWIRPMGLIFILSLIIYLLFIKNKYKIIKPIIGYIITICFIGCISMVRTGLFLYQAKTGWMALADYSWDNTQNKTKDNNPRYITKNKGWNVCQKDSAYKSYFLNWFNENTNEYIKQIPYKFLKTYISDNVNMCTFIQDKENKKYMYEEISMKTLIKQFPYYNITQTITIINLLFYYSLIITAFMSFKFFKKEYHLLPLCIIILGTMLLIFVGHGEARFHIPFMPFIIILSSIYVKNTICKTSVL